MSEHRAAYLRTFQDEDHCLLTLAIPPVSGALAWARNLLKGDAELAAEAGRVQQTLLLDRVLEELEWLHDIPNNGLVLHAGPNFNLTYEPEYQLTDSVFLLDSKFQLVC